MVRRPGSWPNWFDTQERQASDADFGLSGDDLLDALGETEAVLADLLAGEGGAEVQAAVDQLLLGSGWSGRAHRVGAIATKRVKVADAPDHLRAALSDLVRRALVEMARRRRERLRGSPNGVSFDHLFANGAGVQPGAADKGQGALLSRVAEQWIEECGPGWAKSTEIEFRAAARMLQEALGDVPIDRIDRAALREFKGAPSAGAFPVAPALRAHATSQSGRGQRQRHHRPPPRTADRQ
jgi:hypothetical protein